MKCHFCSLIPLCICLTFTSFVFVCVHVIYSYWLKLSISYHFYIVSSKNWVWFQFMKIVQMLSFSTTLNWHNRCNTFQALKHFKAIINQIQTCISENILWAIYGKGLLIVMSSRWPAVYLTRHVTINVSLQCDKIRQKLCFLYGH